MVVACTPSPEKVCSLIKNDTIGRLVEFAPGSPEMLRAEAEEQSSKRGCIQAAEKLKKDRPDHYKRYAKCVMGPIPEKYPARTWSIKCWDKNADRVWPE
jgi:hypothetical protein